MNCPVDLRRLYHARRVVPFVGAGASMSVMWDGGKKRGPSWREMVNKAAELIGADTADLLRVRGTDLQILEYFRIKHGSLAKLTNWLSNEFSTATDDDILRSPIHRALADLDMCGVMYTTNYDNFLERALARRAKGVHVTASELSIGHDRSLLEIVKFHGDFDHPEQMVLSESHYMNRMRLESPMDFKLRSDILGRAVLFIGYSFRDPNVDYIFHLVNQLFKQLPDSTSGKRVYIILPDPSEFERLLFQNRNIEVIPVGSHDISAQVAGVLQQMAA
jgi:hypothetical protein